MIWRSKWAVALLASLSPLIKFTRAFTNVTVARKVSIAEQLAIMRELAMVRWNKGSLDTLIRSALAPFSTTAKSGLQKNKAKPDMVNSCAIATALCCGHGFL